MSRFRAAILGYGRSGSTMHADALDAVEDFQVAACCDIDPQRREQAAERFGCKVYEDYRKMLAEESLDLVSVITRSDQHAEMTCECLAAGANVLVTKPWCVDEHEARSMVTAAEKAGRLLMPWLPARQAPDTQRIAELIAEGAVGEVFRVRRAEGGYAQRDDWQTETRYGGGYLLNWGPHVVDTAVYVTGRPAVERVLCGEMRNLHGFGDAEDIFFTVLRLEGGLTVHAEYDFAVCRPWKWIVQGKQGTIYVDDETISIHAGPPSAPADPTRYADMQAAGPILREEKIHGVPYGDPKAIYRQIAAALAGEGESPVPPRDALELSRVFDAVREADRTGESLALDPPARLH